MSAGWSTSRMDCPASAMNWRRSRRRRLRCARTAAKRSGGSSGRAVSVIAPPWIRCPSRTRGPRARAEPPLRRGRAGIAASVAAIASARRSPRVGDRRARVWPARRRRPSRYPRFRLISAICSRHTPAFAAPEAMVSLPSATAALSEAARGSVRGRCRGGRSRHRPTRAGSRRPRRRHRVRGIAYARRTRSAATSDRTPDRAS